MFTHAASADVWDDSPTTADYEEIFAKKAVGDTKCGVTFDNGTIFDALGKANVPYRIYAGDELPQVGLLAGISLYQIETFADFAGDIADPTYDAAYTFIEPAYGTVPQTLDLPFVNNSQHPSNSVALGEGLIKSVYEAIRNSPNWNESMLVITWDEHGGFYDHVTPPPAKCIPTKSSPNGLKGKFFGFKFDQYGPRVPAVVISPWCLQNLIEHRQLEHSVIPATIEQLFNLQPLTTRDTGVTGLQALATLASPRNVTVAISDPITVKPPTSPVPAIAPIVSSVISSGGVLANKMLRTASVGASAAVAAPLRALDPSQQPLDLDDPWLAAALAVAIKAHIEAVPGTPKASRLAASA